MNKALLAAFSGLIIAGFVACNKDQRDPCLQPRFSVLRVHCVRHYDTSAALIDTALPAPLLFPITNQAQKYVFGGTGRVIYFSLQLSNLADSTSWILQPDSLSSVRDTLSFFYQKQLHFLSNACGYSYFYHVDSVRSTKNAIDSLRLEATDVTNDASVEHLKIIFKYH